MNNSSRLVLLLHVLALLVSANAMQRTQRMPVALRTFNIRFLRGTYAGGLTTDASLQCLNIFFRPVRPSTLQTAAAIVNRNGGKSFASPIMLQQQGSSGVFRNGNAQVKIVARGPIFRRRYLFVVIFNGTDFLTVISNVRVFNRLFRNRVRKFITTFSNKRVRDVSRNRRCRRRLPRRFRFPKVTPSPNPAPTPDMMPDNDMMPEETPVPMDEMMPEATPAPMDEMMPEGTTAPMDEGIMAEDIMPEDTPSPIS